MTEIEKGKYQHYKGKFYEVIGVARHSETLEEIELNGEMIPRFKFVGD